MTHEIQIRLYYALKRISEDLRPNRLLRRAPLRDWPP